MGVDRRDQDVFSHILDSGGMTLLSGDTECSKIAGKVILLGLNDVSESSKLFANGVFFQIFGSVGDI